MKILYPIIGVLWFLLSAILIRLTWSWVGIIQEMFTDDYVIILYWIFILSSYLLVLVVAPIYLILLGFSEDASTGEAGS